ncbi:LysR family transcriptional regulator [Bombilactobacillus bombi]|uniref:LysR family transcriptional regulator n=1 Tax=Bombilactobacillus bombi TaxID=1303590 RepID=UPI002810D2F4|nr:LysR family transcriptional regulator [Bombilactobacillus bombi]
MLIAVADLKSINKASSILMQTQPAISKKIKNLENYYGKQLFIRSSTGMELTLDGQKIYLEAQKIIDQFEKLRNNIIEDNNINMKNLKIGTLDSISSYMYPSFFAISISNFKKINITNKIFDLIVPFNNKKLDAILMDTAFKKEILGKFEEIKLFEEPYCLVFSSKNPDIARIKENSISANNIKKLNIIMYPKYCPIHKRIVQIYNELNITAPKIIEVDYSESTISIVSRSNYVTILPKSLAVNKVTLAPTKLAMKQLDNTFRRKVSLFARDNRVLNYVYNSLY